LVAKFYSDVACVTEVGTYSNDFGASGDGTLTGVDVEEVRRAIVVEDVVVICVLLIVEGDFNDGGTKDIGRRGIADCLGRVDDLGWDFGEVFKTTEGVVGVVNGEVFEGVEVTTFKEDTGTTSIWTTIGHQLLNGWPRVVPIVNTVLRILLVVERNCKRDGLLHHI
jgi:hypothetical protein